MTLAVGPSIALPAPNNDTLIGDDLTIPTNEASTATTMCPNKETNIGVSNKRKTTIISSSIAAKWESTLV
jgi:hypothetical protein